MRYFTVSVTDRRSLAESTFEIRLKRPHGFAFQPGQKIGFHDQTVLREYTLLGPEESPELAVCVRRVSRGRFSPRLAEAKAGDRYKISEPYGYFTFKPSGRPAVFVATGTGVAPFVAYVRSGVRGDHLFHGVHRESELYYRGELANAVNHYIPCLSGDQSPGALSTAFIGYVTAALNERLSPAAYDFYLCGRNDMIRDAIRIIDDTYPDSRVFSEVFY